MRVWPRLSFSRTPPHLGATGWPIDLAFQASPTLYQRQNRGGAENQGFSKKVLGQN